MKSVYIATSKQSSGHHSNQSLFRHIKKSKPNIRRHAKAHNQKSTKTNLMSLVIWVILTIQTQRIKGPKTFDEFGLDKSSFVHISSCSYAKDRRVFNAMVQRIKVNSHITVSAVNPNVSKVFSETFGQHTTSLTNVQHRALDALDSIYNIPWSTCVRVADTEASIRPC